MGQEEGTGVLDAEVEVLEADEDREVEVTMDLTLLDAQPLRVPMPLGDRLLVKPAAAEEMTEGGLHIPTQAQEAPVWGTVISMGPGKVGNHGQWVGAPQDPGEIAVKPGDQVAYGRYAGNKLELDGVTWHMLKFADLHSVIREISYSEGDDDGTQDEADSEAEPEATEATEDEAA